MTQKMAVIFTSFQSGSMPVPYSGLALIQLTLIILQAFILNETPGFIIEVHVIIQHLGMRTIYNV